MPEGEFENQPATKRDLADMSEELMKEIQRVEGSLGEKIDRLGGKVGRLAEKMATKEDMKAGFHHLEEIFKGPEGFGERLERVEKRVGLKV